MSTRPPIRPEDLGPVYDELTEIRQRVQKEIASSLLLKPVPTPVYQYTGFKNLESILQSQRIWATESQFMNDPTEQRHAAHLFAEFIRTEWKQAPFFAPVAGAVEADARDRPGWVFVASFCAEGDDLTQWDRYADHATGIALGFDLGEVQRAPSFRIADDLGELLVNPCIYDKRKQLEVVKAFLNPLLVHALSRFLTAPLSEREVLVPVTINVLLGANLLGMVLKHPKYHAEQEWRVLTVCDRTIPPTILGHHVNAHGENAPHVPLRLSGEGRLPLRSVLVGPRADAQAVQSVRALLDRYGHPDVTVTRSEIPYRG